MEKDSLEMDKISLVSAEEQEAEQSDLIDFVWEHNRPHPMCIPHIVDNILRYLNPSDLKSCRLVNSQYNEISCYNLAKKEVITFSKMSNITSYLRWMPISSLNKQRRSTDLTCSGRSSAGCSSFHEEAPDLHSGNNENTNSLKRHRHKEMKDVSLTEDEQLVVVGASQQDGEEQDIKVESHFAKNYAHSSFHFNFDPDCLVGSETNENNKNVQILEEFFTKIGPHVKSLKYTTDFIPFNFPKRLPHIGDIWGRNRLENLETLSFEIKWGIPRKLFEESGNEEGGGRVVLPSLKRLFLDIVVTEREADRAAVFLRQLLAAAPNLQEISIPGNKKFFDDYINVLLGRIILTVPLPKLTTLDFCLALNETQILGLAERKFPLKSLILDFAEVQQFSFLAPPPVPVNLPGLLIDDDNNNNNNHHLLQQNHFALQSQLLNRSLYNLFLLIAPTLEKLHLCFPYSPSHPLHRFTFPVPMSNLKHLALGGFYGSVRILDHLPIIQKLELWNVQFHDFGSYNKDDKGNDSEQAKEFIVPHQYLGITTVIS